MSNMELRGFQINIYHKDKTDYEQSTGARYIIVPSIGDLIMTRQGPRKVIAREFLMGSYKIELTVEKP